MPKIVRTKPATSLAKVERTHRLGHPDNKVCRACHFIWPCPAIQLAREYRKLQQANTGLRGLLTRSRQRDQKMFSSK